MREINCRDLPEAAMGTGLRILLWSAAWCAPCQQFKPVLERFSRSRDLEVLQVDISRCPAEVLSEHLVTMIPTVSFWRDDEWLGNVSGPRDQATLDEMVAELAV